MVRGAYIASHEQVQCTVGKTNVALTDRYSGDLILDFAPRSLLIRFGIIDRLAVHIFPMNGAEDASESHVHPTVRSRHVDSTISDPSNLDMKESGKN